MGHVTIAYSPGQIEAVGAEDLDWMKEKELRAVGYLSLPIRLDTKGSATLTIVHDD